MAYPPAPGTTGSSLPPKPPAPAGGNPNTIGLGSGGGFTKKSGFKPAFSSDATSAYPAKPPQQGSTFSSAPGTYHGAPTYAGPAAPPPMAAQYGPSSYSAPHGGAPGAVNSTSYQKPPQQTSYQSQNWNQKQSNWQPRQAQQQQQTGYSQPPPAPSAGPSSYGPQTYGPQSYSQQPTSYGGTPQIQNPFNRQAGSQGAPTAGYGGDYANGADEAAQIAQWQSAYVSKGPTADKDEQDEAAEPSAYAQAAAANNNTTDKKKTVYRKGGGKSWQDDSLLEWDPAHFRLFVGNLAGETTDDSLLKAFSRWPSVQKARVIRDKRTSKSKGYGFVSMSDSDQFFQAAREMHGKYIQSHPVTVKRANTEIKSANVKDKNKKFKNNNHGSGNGSTNGQANQPQVESPALGPRPGSGIVKPGKKTKNGLKLLG